LYRRWIDDLWNGPADAAALRRVAESLVTDGFVGHWPDRDVRGRAELADLVAQTKTMFSGHLAFTVEIPPFTEGDLVAARWTGTGTSPAGDVSHFWGNDILRLSGTRFAEYWVASVQA